ncbi:thymidine kinase [Ilyomonas limi]|uniref:Thymidine kinase n=1 Tax=Ilyomonas limi TaxID=2575867 RepID=A0A4U3L167_9BACT|nr:thymidine kinase [Ilyomonas limi]TKK67187.1 thymidine kinase [Ilyomonas limi]
MFIEPSINGAQRGWIEVICGSMFSGKTEELIRRLRRAKIANLRIEIYKPAIDNRYHQTDVVSHDANSISSTIIENSQTILLYASHVDVVGIDEAQFFDPEIVSVCEKLAARGIRVIVAGLDMDYKGRPFGPMPALLAIADYITKLHAICVRCGNIASYSYRKTAQGGQVLLGETDVYEPRCRKCYYEEV